MSIFGTDGVRGTAGTFPLDRDTVYRIGLVLGGLLPPAGNRRVILGGDTRESTPGILALLGEGLRERAEPENAGTVPTPAVAELVAERNAAAGVSVSASHNPWTDNGIKIFGADGRKWSDRAETELERRLAASGLPGAPPSPRALDADPALPEIYLRALERSVPGRLTGLRVAIDCANGAAWTLGPEAFRRAGAHAVALADRPDGRNINAGCGAVHPEWLAARIAPGRFDLGVALDGDADRAILCAEDGRIVDGDDVLWIAARAEKEAGRLGPPKVVGTVMSNFGLETALAGEGIELLRAPVGDRNVARLMADSGARLGGEPSGHVLFGGLSTTGDGILTAMWIAALLVRTGRPLSALADLARTPQVLRNVRVHRKVPIDDAAVLAAQVSKARERLGIRGRVLLRYSGTEPLLRIMVEGTDAPVVEEIAAALAETASLELAAGP